MIARLLTLKGSGNAGTCPPPHAEDGDYDPSAATQGHEYRENKSDCHTNTNKEDILLSRSRAENKGTNDHHCDERD
ncbi:hypothetical protein N9H94_00795 [Akkermansiaceae bacterium]|nr:hypothetical protein [Akkermansiaceae bacterium]MDA8980733.1 hypothetical protein [bacterium]MDB4546366.1 hypothetical protein [Akkermansiaceae bacterium]